MSFQNQWIEKRKVKRREIVDQFSFYICIPKLGFTRHKVNDISELGIGFVLETLGEFVLHKDEECDLQFYLNQSLAIDLKIKVARTIDRDEQIQEIGAFFIELDSKQHKTFKVLVEFVDRLSELNA